MLTSIYNFLLSKSHFVLIFLADLRLQSSYILEDMIGVESGEPKRENCQQPSIISKLCYDEYSDVMRVSAFK